MRAPAAPLEILANNSSPDSEKTAADLRRWTRYGARSVQWEHSSLPRCRSCGRVPVGQGVTLRLSNGIAGFSGLETCGSVWSCPTCAAKILVRRAFEIGAVLGQAQAQGHALAFATFTMRHHRGQPLEDLWRAAGKAWSKATSGKCWKVDVDLFEVGGWVRVWEVTHGRNGWHVHVHLVLILAGDVKATELDTLCGPMFGRWSRALQREGLEAPLLRAQDWHLIGGDSDEVAHYLTKFAGSTVAGADALGLELTHVQAGRSRSSLKTSPVWSLLDEVGRSTAGLGRWHEWERGSKGKRQVGWMAGTRERFGLPEAERTDEEIAQEEAGTQDDDLILLSRAGWSMLVADWERLPMLLMTAESSGLRGVRAMLDRWEVPYGLCVQEEAR